MRNMRIACTMLAAASGLQLHPTGLHRPNAHRCVTPRMSFLLIADEAVEALDAAAEPLSVGEAAADVVESVSTEVLESVSDAVESLTDGAVDAEALVASVGAFVGEYGALGLALVSIPILLGLVKAAGAALEAAKPVFIGALATLVVTLGFGTSVQLTKLPLVGGLLGDPAELFAKLVALIAVAGASAVAYSKTTEAISGVTAKADEALSGASEKLKSSIPGVPELPTLDLPEIDVPQVPQVPNVKNPFRTPDADSAVPPAFVEEVEEEYDASPRPSFRSKFDDKIAELKERDEKKRAGRQ